MTKLLFTLLGAATVAAVALGSLSVTARPQVQPVPPQARPSTSSPTTQGQDLATPSPEELGGFPVYPDATFLGKKQAPTCGDEVNGYAFCDVTVYSWRTPDDGDSVLNWYWNDKAGSDWSCSGGGGSYISARNLSGITFCRKGDLRYRLFVRATTTRTIIEVGIKNK